MVLAPQRPRVLAPQTWSLALATIEGHIDRSARRCHVDSSTSRNPLTAIPLRAARWSATHPWRAILAWLAFVLVAVGLAVAVPTAETKDADYRLGESGRADAMVDASGLDEATTENVLVNPRGDAALDQGEATAAASQIRAGMRDLEGVETVSEPQWNPDRSALLIAVQLARDQEDATALQDVTERVQAEHPELQIRQAGDLSIDAGIDDRVADDLSAAEGISLPGHADPDAAGIRRPDRGRDPGAARSHERGRHDRDHRARCRTWSTPREPSAA